MKGTILFCALALFLVTPGCIKSEQTSQCAENDVILTHTPVNVTLVHETQLLQMKNSIEIKELFEVKCSLCHPLGRAKSTGKNYDDLLMTVYFMKNRYCALITEEEVVIIAGYINETYGK
jgi:lipoprotein NlpI